MKLSKLQRIALNIAREIKRSPNRNEARKKLLEEPVEKGDLPKAIIKEVDRDLSIISANTESYPPFDRKILELRNLLSAKNRNEDSLTLLAQIANKELDSLPEVFGLGIPSDFEAFLFKTYQIATLFRSAKIDFYSEVSRKYDAISYTSDPYDIGKKVLYGNLLLAEQKEFSPESISPSSLSLEDLSKQLSSLNKEGKRLYLENIIFEPYTRANEYSKGFDITETLNNLSSIALFMPDFDEASDESKEYMVTGFEEVSYVRKGKLVKDSIEYDANDEVCELLSEIGEDLYNTLLLRAEERENNSTNPFSLSEGGSLATEDNDDANYCNNLEYEMSKQEILIAGFEKQIFDLPLDKAFKLYKIIITDESRKRFSEALISTCDSAKQKEQLEKFFLDKAQGNNLVWQTDIEDPSLQRYYSLYNYYLSREGNKNKSETLTQVAEFLNDEDPIIKGAAIDLLSQSSTEENDSIVSLRKNFILNQIFNEYQGDKEPFTLALILFRSKLDAEYEVTDGQRYETILRELFSKDETNAITLLDSLAEANLPTKFDKNARTFSKFTRDEYLEFLSLPRLVFWIKDSKNPALSLNAKKLLVEFSKEKLIVEIGSDLQAQQILFESL